MTNNTIHYNDTLEITYSISNDTGNLEDIIDINVNEESEKISHLENKGDEFKNIKKFTWSPDEENVGDTYTFEIGKQDLSIKVIDTPDNATYNWPMLSRSDNTIVELIEERNGTASDTNNISGNFVRGYSEESISSDSNIELGELPKLNNSIFDSLTLVGTITVSDDDIVSFSIDSSQSLSFNLNRSNREDNSPRVRIGDWESDNRCEVIGDANTVATDGSKQRVVITYNDPSLSGIDMYVNGESIGTRAHDDDWSNEFSVGPNTTLNFSNSGIQVDNIIISNQKWDSNDVIEDYNNQPWS